MRTVAELITLLQTFPQDALVLIPSYEGGYELPADIHLRTAQDIGYTDKYTGPFIASDEAGTVPAIFFERATEC